MLQAVGRAVASNAIDSQFESSSRQIVTLNIDDKIKKKRQGMAPLKNKCWNIRISLRSILKLAMAQIGSDAYRGSRKPITPVLHC